VFDIIFSPGKWQFQIKDVYWLTTVELITSLFFCIGLIFIGVGTGAGILAGIMAGAMVFYIYRNFYNDQAKPNRTSRKIGQMLIGLGVGLAVKHDDLAAVSPQIPIFLLLTFLLLGLGIAIAYLYKHLIKTDYLTAIFATVPGNIGIMGSIAADYGKNPALVSLIQVMRFTAVILLVPLMVQVPISHNFADTINTFTHSLQILEPVYLLKLCAVFGMTVLAVETGNKLNIPVAAFFCAIFTGIVINFLPDILPIVSPDYFQLPAIFNLLGQLLLGLTIGEYWGINPQLSPKNIIFAALPVAMTLSGGLIVALVAKLITHWDWLTCLLVSVPGGSPEMIWIALTLNHHVEIITAGHLIRLITINMMLPLMILAASHLDGMKKQHQYQEF
jgi:membrane AbrB-like protein